MIFDRNCSTEMGDEVSESHVFGADKASERCPSAELRYVPRTNCTSLRHDTSCSLGRARGFSNTAAALSIAARIAYIARTCKTVSMTKHIHLIRPSPIIIKDRSLCLLSPCLAHTSSQAASTTIQQHLRSCTTQNLKEINHVPARHGSIAYNRREDHGRYGRRDA